MRRRGGAPDETGSRAGPRAISAAAGAEPIEAPAGSKPAAGLYIVATPIGNAEDITLRALRLLRQADAVVCEDTRVTRKLLSRHGIAARLFAYHEHNAERMRPVLLARLKEGASLALVSDAGTPLVSDPGFKLVRAAIAEGIAVSALPGPAAPLAALVLSGLPSDRFHFAGFLPPRQAARRRALGELAAIDATLILFESASRLVESLADMAAVLGSRAAAVTRELTKLHEEIRRGDLAGLAAHYAASGPPLGEIVIVIGPPEAEAAQASEAALDAELGQALLRMSVKDAAAAVSASTGLPRRKVYARALALAERGSG